MKTTRPIFPTPTPTFTTARLLLRAFKSGDLPDCYELRTQIEVMQWSSRGIIDPDQAFTANWLKRLIPPNDATTFTYAIEELSHPGKVIGTCGVTPKSEIPEVGYMFRKDAWGKGYATESLEAWLKIYWALPRQPVDTEERLPGLERHWDGEVAREVLHAEIVDANDGSQKVLQKCGFVRGETEALPDRADPKTMIDITFYYLERPVG